MDLFPESLDHYIEQHTSPESEVLEELNRETNLNVLMPRMLSGHIQGVVLKMISHMIRPKRILEIGTYTGYSGICLADGLTADGLLYTIDINEELEDMVSSYLKKAGVDHKVKQLIGDAMEIIPTLNETFDLVFIDADKVNYVNYYHMVFDKVRVGGYFLADNVLWSGKVADDTKQDKDTNALRELNALIQNDDRVENVILSVRDGLLLARKLKD
ncbi:MAG: O-methyltransferase [Flammeovirgaceae bacterium]